MISSNDRATVPDFLKHRPTYKGLIVPFFTAVHDGVPNFRAHDLTRHRNAMERRLCGVCGHRLDQVLAVLAGPSELERRTTYMPAMHERCARYALSVCPFLATQGRVFAMREDDALVSSAEPLPKPMRIALAKVGRYQVLRAGDMPGTEYVHFSAPKTVEWFAYVEGKLKAVSASEVRP